MTEWVSWHLITGPLQLGQDRLQPSAFGDEDVDRADTIHLLFEASGLDLKIEDCFWDVDAVYVPSFSAEPDVGQPGSSVKPFPVGLCCGGREPSAAPSHDLMDQEHPRSGVVLADDVLCETRCLLGRRPGAERLAHGDDVVVDGLRQPDHSQRVAVAGEECGKIARGGVGVVAADGVQDVDAVGRQSISRGLQGVQRPRQPSRARPGRLHWSA